MPSLRRSTVTLVAAVSILALLPAVAGASPLPNPDLGPNIDPYARHQSPQNCISSAQPGVVAFRAILQEAYGANGGGITRNCSGSATSDHHEGRAYDWMLDASKASDRAKADAVLDWLLSTDKYGNEHAMARRLGVNYIIWDHQWWASWNAGAGWRAYTGWHPHDDHIHFSFSWAGARQETSFWTGTGPFPDVPHNRYFTKPVEWMLDEGITNGVGNTGEFRPHQEMTRGEMATFMWRTMDRPTGYPGHGFPDVPSSAYYADPVRWLTGENITDGYGDTGRFEPGREVTREQMAAFMWRMAGRPASTADHGFPDVRRGSYYEDAVAWMVEHGITDGYGNTGRYEPRVRVSRAQAAAFLYRLATTEAAWGGGVKAPSTARF